VPQSKGNRLRPQRDTQLQRLRQSGNDFMSHLLERFNDAANGRIDKVQRRRQEQAATLVWEDERTLALAGTSRYLWWRETTVFGRAKLVNLASTEMYAVYYLPENIVSQSGQVPLVRHPAGHVTFSLEEALTVAEMALYGYARPSYGIGSGNIHGCTWNFTRPQPGVVDAGYLFELIFPTNLQTLSSVMVTIHAGYVDVHTTQYPYGQEPTVSRELVPTDQLPEYLKRQLSSLEQLVGLPDHEFQTG
jgi:hypothetical protein